MGLYLLTPVRPQVVAFDIFGTTFSLESLRPRLVALGAPPGMLETWFAAGLRDAFALAASGSFEPFRTVLDGALGQVLAKQGLRASPQQRIEVLDGMRELSPHPDAEEALATLTRAGLRVMAVSNGATSSTRHLLDRSGLGRFMERIVSVDDVKRSKPAPEIYHFAARETGVEPQAIALVATHPWDIQGAKQAGWLGAYVARGVPFPASVMRGPDIEAETLADVAGRITELTP